MLSACWRWFPKDIISLQQIKQTGAVGITTFCDKPIGQIWTKDDISNTKQMIDNAGLKWMVVECLNVHEDIILGVKQKRDKYISNYIQTIINLSKFNLNTICYHFRPLMEWCRTNNSYKYYDGSYTSIFDYIDLAIFEIFIAKHPTATIRYDTKIQQIAAEKYHKMTNDNINNLTNSILLGFSDNIKTLKQFKKKINDEKYLNLSKQKLQENLKYFLDKIIPICIKYKVKMALHPDEPPFNIFGIPRIISSTDDVKHVLNIFDSYYNGITLCVGTFACRIGNNLYDIINICGNRIHYLHLRNIKKMLWISSNTFYETNCFDGDINFYKILINVLKVNNVNNNLCIRCVHGNYIFDDMLSKYASSGYTLYGRTKCLAELRGLIYAISKL